MGEPLGIALVPTATLPACCKPVVLALWRQQLLAAVSLLERRVKTLFELFCGFGWGEAFSYSHEAYGEVRVPGTKTGLKVSVELRRACKAEVIYIDICHYSHGSLCPSSTSLCPALRKSCRIWPLGAQEDIFINKHNIKLCKKKKKFPIQHTKLSALMPLFYEWEHEQVLYF